MFLVSPVDLLPPSICIICETSPDGDFVVDTLYNLKTGVATPLNGRKYVCQRCAEQFGELFGLVSKEKEQRAQLEAEVAKTELSNVKQRVVELSDHIRAFVENPAAADVVEAPVPTQSPANINARDRKFEEVFGQAPKVSDEPAADNRSVASGADNKTAPKKVKDVSK
jgi:hypothetical protein